MDKCQCPFCGTEDVEINVEFVEVDGDGLADYVFQKLMDKGYAPKFKEINTILDIIDEYMIKGVLDGEQD
jgi:hypothetical protein